MENNLIESNDYLMRARALFKAEKYVEAEKNFNKSIEKNKMNIDAYIGLACMYIDQKEYAKAKDNLKKVLVIDNKNGEAYFHIANIAFMNKDNISARENYSKAISFGYDSPVALYYMAMSNYATKDIVNAKFYLNQILEKNPENVKARLKLIEMSMSESKYEESLVQADQLILYRPDAFEGYHYKFLSLINMNKDEAALSVLTHAQKLYPGDKGFAYDRVLLLIKLEKYEEALEYIDAIFIKEDNAKMAIMPLKAKILFKLQRFSESRDVFEKVNSKLMNEESKWLLTMTYIINQSFEKALNVVDNIINSKRDESNIYYISAIFYKGICLKQMGQEESAKKAFFDGNQKIKMQSIKEPGNLSLFMYRILCETFLGNYELALELADYALEISEENSEIYLARSVVYKMMNKKEESIADYEKAKKKNAQLADMFKEVLFNE